jgi:hypothetical protein
MAVSVATAIVALLVLTAIFRRPLAEFLGRSER